MTRKSIVCISTLDACLLLYHLIRPDLFVLYDRDGDGYLDPEEIGRLAHGSAAAMRALLSSVKPDSAAAKMTPEEKDKAEKVCLLLASFCA